MLLGSAHAIKNRLAGWLNRAKYSPLLLGHFALNLPAYGHFTSPIRRLADLLNHRMLKARIHSQPSPYSKLDLVNLSNHINQTVVADDQQDRERYKAQAKRDLQYQMETADTFAQLPPKELSRLIKHADGTLNTALKTEVCSRLGQDQLQVQDIYLLLVRGDDADLKQQLLTWLEAHLHHAPSVLSTAVTQEETWESMEYEELQQSGQFLIWVEVAIANHPKTTIEPGCASRKQVARHRACWLWLEQSIQGALVEPDQRVVPEVKSEVPKHITQEPQSSVPSVLAQVFDKPLVDGQNHIGKLHELCQAMGWEIPSFEFVDLEEGFRCGCHLGVDGISFTAVGTATKKKLAKQRAALDVLEQLRDRELSKQ